MKPFLDAAPFGGGKSERLFYSAGRAALRAGRAKRARGRKAPAHNRRASKRRGLMKGSAARPLARSMSFELFDDAACRASFSTYG